MSAANILLEEWKTPFGLPPFEKIRDEDFLPAFRQAMQEHLAEVEGIADAPGEPAFQNTIEALENSGRSPAGLNGANVGVYLGIANSLAFMRIAMLCSLS